jgi:heavy metal sensor kinase
MFRTIRVRLTLWYVALLALFLLGFSVALYFTLARSLDQQVDATLRLNAEQLAGGVNIEQGQVNFQSSESDLTDAASLREQGYLVRLLDASGGVADTNARLAALPVVPSALDAARSGQPWLDTFVVNGHSFRVYTRPIVEGGQFYGALQVAQSLDPVANTLRQLLLLLAAIVPLTLVFALAGGFWFARRALGPIDRITTAAQRMSAEDLTQRLGLNLPDDEVGRLARTFDGMLARLDAAFRRERQFTADASHELRTPLTAMRGEIDVTLNRPRSAAEYRRALEELGGDVDRLTRLAEDLLTLARADAGRLPLQRGTLNVSQLLHAVAEQLRPLAESKNILLNVRADDALAVWADEDKLLRVVLNLADNALKFTPAGGRVMLSASRTAGQIELVVSDTGAGMSAQDLPHIFERFYRADESHSPGTGGAGLGLAIAHSLVIAQGGTIEVKSALGQGTTFVVKLPSKGKR